MSLEIIGMDTVIGAIQDELDEIAGRARNAVKLGGQAYANDVKALAQYKTGIYRRSIHVEMIEEGGNPVALVGTDLPQAKRLEFGFWDMMDSLGRHFMQYPRPHFRPPLDTEMDRYLAIMRGELSGDGATGTIGADSRLMNVFAQGIRPDLISSATGRSSNIIPKAPKATNIWSKVSTTYRRTTAQSKPVRK